MSAAQLINPIDKNKIADLVLSSKSFDGENEDIPLPRHIKRLSSTEKLNIDDFDEFLTKSKTDFEFLYQLKTISKIKITDFNLIEKLGSGAFGKVILAEYKNDSSHYAIKIIEKKLILEKKQVRYVNNEKRTLQSINFPFLIDLKYFFVDFCFLYIVMPFVPGGTFHTYIKKYSLNEADAKFYTAQLVLAIEYLHYLEVIHRDVKPDNIMLDSLGYLKLGDFGQSIRSRGVGKCWTITGTPEYMAPEVIFGNGYDFAVDWWSLGVIVYEMCAGYRPFKHSNLEKMEQQIMDAKYKVPNGFSVSLRNFVMRLLQPNPKKRLPYTGGATNLKNHKWMKEIDWLSILNRTVSPPYIPEVDNKFIKSYKSNKLVTNK